MAPYFVGIIAVIVATVVYRWQKKIDRETVLMSEQRQLFAKYISCLNSHFLSQPYLGVQNDESSVRDFYSISSGEIEIYGLRDQIFLIAPLPVIAHMELCDNAFRDWKRSFTTTDSNDPDGKATVMAAMKEFKKAKILLMNEMRETLQRHGSDSLLDELKMLFK